MASLLPAFSRRDATDNVDSSVTIQGRTVLLRLVGDLDAPTADDLDLRLKRAAEKAAEVRAAKLHIDMQRVRSIDAEAVRRLLAAYDAAGDTGTSFRVVAVSPSVRRTLEQWGIAMLLNLPAE